MKRKKTENNSEPPLEKQVLTYIGKKDSMSVQELYDGLSKENIALTRREVTDTIWRLKERGTIELEDTPLNVSSITDFLGLWERNLPIYASLIVSLATVVVVYALPSQLPFVAVRWVLGLVFVLFIPGYVTLKVLFPERGLDSLERFALSIGLSLAIVPLIGLVLNFTPWGIRLNPIIVSLYILTTGLALIALTRQYLYSTSMERPTEP